MVNNGLKEFYRNKFIYHSYACIVGKGTHRAVDAVQHNFRLAKRNYGAASYILKIDIAKFFYSIDREVLKSIIRRDIKCKRLLELIEIIIDSAQTISKKGLPLGNTISQLLANVYMNELDHYCKRSLQTKHYVRYADDIVIFCESKEQANDYLYFIEKYLKNKLKLKVNEHKTKVFPISQGVNAYGFKIHATHRLIRTDTKTRMKQKTKKLIRLERAGRVCVVTVNQVLSSYAGHCKYAATYTLISRLMNNNDGLTMTGNALKYNRRGDNYVAI